ncbi:class I SAM-dependent methyltransferase [Glutamicibacter arilaitensis]|uniref:class I SAM-dependent methyltransferase n=1 Tax=Glutamicibacter arilaitensis TaxID=256701 RepID=UPI0038509EA5
MTHELLNKLRRWPEVEGENLFAHDAADRLMLDTVHAWPHTVSIVGDQYGALSLGALSAGATHVRVHTDSLTARRAITANLQALAPQQVAQLEFCALDTVAADATLVLLRLPRGGDVLDEQASAIASAASSQAVVHAGGMLKHMNRTMNQTLATYFSTLEVSLARQKARVLTASAPLPTAHSHSYPRSATHQVNGTAFTLTAGAATFGAQRLDPGTALLLENLPDLSGHTRLLDLACGNGSIGVYAALTHPALLVDASDHSASAVASTGLSAQANHLSARITAVQDDGLSRHPDASATLITLNPPFHIGNTVHAGIALKLFDEAARVLAEGGELICVFNSHLRYRSELASRIGPTQQLARNSTFTVTRSIRRR